GREVNAWHRELRATVTQLFDALASGDEASLTKLVADAQVRRRLPSTLRPDTACDAADSTTNPQSVSVAAMAEHTPWALTFQRGGARRSEEHTSELQSRFDLVCRLLLEKKKEIYADTLAYVFAIVQ